MNLSLILLTLVLYLTPSLQKKDNKYSREVNSPSKEINYREIKDPFRMGKVNAVWNKALHKLTDTKLKSLYTDLSIHDKDQLRLKRLKTDGLDKDGMEEATVRKKFKDILSNYGLFEHFIDGEKPPKTGHVYHENDINKSIFKDKKLAKLWEKAERSGFSEKELKVLKEEFAHHQDKVDEYYAVLEKEEQQKHPNFLNPLSSEEAQDHFDKSYQPSKKYPDGGLPLANEIRSKHRDLKDGYDKLHRRIAGAPDSKEFAEPKVAALWKLAQNADFSPDELDSLRQELKHYEKRLEKLHYFQSEQLAKKINSGTPNTDKHTFHTDKDTETSFYEGKIKKHETKAEKLHLDLETKILARQKNEL